MEEHGFLEVSSKSITKDIDQKHDGLWSLALKLNSAANKLQYNLSAHLNAPHELVGTPLYIRSISNYQAFLILVSKGMLHQSHIMLRALVEVMFPLVAISKDSAFAFEYIRHDEHSRKGVLSKLKRYKETVDKEDPRIEQTNEIIESIKDNIDTNDIHKYSTEELSIKAGLHSWYDTVYAITSAAVHTTPRSIEGHLVINEDDGAITGFKNEPEIDNIDTALSTGINTMQIAIEAICDIFSIDYPNSLKDLDEELQSHLNKKA